ncbi:hypothetical protein BV25DRAFT_1185689 [Artomyces pyxidatus]|uniref:Uncharacterized protein n=1 Tax=Artomyces pyxidatus TaxID=48021 RepID=A0ACB8SR84_9AGAM|nr:hypothetical protein BV25DRAFT_1185689 [Artomyces pyxidatus]
MLATLPDIPLDVFLLIVRNLEIGDVLALTLTCRHLYTLSTARSVWRIVLDQLIDSFIPIPPSSALPGDTLSAPALKRTALHAMALHQVWASAYPIAKRKINAPSSSISAMQITGSHFIRGHGNRYVVSTEMTIRTGGINFEPRYILRCIDFNAEIPRVVASREFRDHIAIVTNDVPDSVVAISLRVRNALEATSVTHTYNLDSATGDLATMNEFVTDGDPLILSGDVLVTGDKSGNVFLYDVRAGALMCQLHDPLASPVTETVRAVLLPGKVLTFNYTTIKLYELPDPLPAVSSDDPPRIFNPTARHTWRWRIDYLAVAPLVHARAPRPRPVINIWVRFGSWYPWPVNMVHHYVLAPPYVFPPTLTLYTYSALDLFATSEAVLGPYGTVMWTDSQVQNDATAPRAASQRIAAKMLHPFPALDAPPEGGVEDVGVGLGAAADSAITGGRYDRGTTTVFAFMNKGDGEVSHLAMDEETGRVVVSCQDGTISLWDYMPDSSVAYDA